MILKDGILFTDNDKIVTDGNKYGKQIYYLNSETVKNWYEITEEEYNKILEEQESKTQE